MKAKMMTAIRPMVVRRNLQAALLVDHVLHVSSVVILIRQPRLQNPRARFVKDSHLQVQN